MDPSRTGARRSRGARLGLAGAAVASFLGGSLHAAAPQDSDVRRPEPAAIIGLVEVAESVLEQTGSPGVSVAVFAGDEVLWRRGFGVREAGSDPRIDSETLFQAASISKAVAAAGILRMVQEGHFELDREVEELLLEFELLRADPRLDGAVTLRRLLCHGAGTNVHGFPGYPGGIAMPTLLQILAGEDPCNTPAIVVDREPGSEYRYSGGGYCILQQVVVDVLDQPFPDAMADLVLEPAGMGHSTYRQPLPAERTNVCAGHSVDGAVIPGHRNQYPEMAAAGLWTTPEDLCRFAMELCASWNGEEGRLLPPALTREMTRGQVRPGYGLGLGLGQVDGARYFHHGGSNRGFKCFFAAFPATGQGGVVMVNSDHFAGVIVPLLEKMAEVFDWPGVPEP